VTVERAPIADDAEDVEDVDDDETGTRGVMPPEVEEETGRDRLGGRWQVVVHA
jgi:hypothetical protein